MKALVLFSGGLDSRLVVKLLQEQKIEVESVFFQLPFSKQSSPKFEKVRIHIIDCTKGKNLKEYLKMLKSPRHRTGAGINPCVDCKIFIFEKAEQLRKKIGADFLSTGEVSGQRPMSQTSSSLKIIDDHIKNIKRPLIELGISGRNRKKQMELAKKFKINYPTPAGGCLLCEKQLAGRFKFLLDKNLITEKTLQLTKLGRHFYINGWIIVGRDETENKVIEKFQSIKSGKGKPAVYYHDKKNKVTALKLQKAYEDRNTKKFEEYKIK